MKLHLPACLLLVTALGACSSGPSIDEQREEAALANAVAARALAASAPESASALSPWLSAERARIEAARSVAVQQFDDAEKVCWRRFAVNACVREARYERRAKLERLRAEDLALNEVERRRRTEARLRDLELKMEQAAPKRASP